MDWVQPYFSLAPSNFNFKRYYKDHMHKQFLQVVRRRTTPRDWGFLDFCVMKMTNQILPRPHQTQKFQRYRLDNDIMPKLFLKSMSRCANPRNLRFLQFCLGVNEKISAQQF